MMTQSKRVAALCVTCVIDHILPDVGVATVQLLRRAGYTVDFPEAQTCCGQPFFNSGFRQEALALAKRTVVIFEEYEAVVGTQAGRGGGVCVKTREIDARCRKNRATGATAVCP